MEDKAIEELKDMDPVVLEYLKKIAVEEKQKAEKQARQDLIEQLRGFIPELQSVPEEMQPAELQELLNTLQRFEYAPRKIKTAEKVQKVKEKNKAWLSKDNLMLAVIGVIAGAVVVFLAKITF